MRYEYKAYSIPHGDDAEAEILEEAGDAGWTLCHVTDGRITRRLIFIRERKAPVYAHSNEWNKGLTVENE